MSGGPELTEFEQPFLDQLASMGWKLATAKNRNPCIDHEGRRP